MAFTGAVLFVGGLDVSPTLAAEKAAASAAPSIDPVALKAGARMGAYLRSLQSFEVNSSAVLEEVVDEAGKKSTSAVSALYRVRRPDGFLIDMTTPAKARRFVYDGHAFTVFAPKVGYFATIAAPATIDETVKLIYEDYGVILPLADLFYWGTDAQPTDMVTSAKRLGEDKIAGVDTDHYAFAGPGMSWEVWIQRGDAPLPRRMRITTVDDPARPTYTADLTWKTGVTFAPDTFTFKPATGAKPIAMARVGQ
ncbi:DUF2092 domain-containing protein [Caulobacter soli]|uniref:DUF2092 domain-containing protein n=1 Tax=Caulobacter soli TaxID=2708539 RepID=UPI0013EB7543|nr:DUF2092 domain-containing protein [Caulobacter soli]